MTRHMLSRSIEKRRRDNQEGFRFYKRSRSRSIDIRSRENEEAIRERKRIKFVRESFWRELGEKNLGIDELIRPTTMRYDGRGRSDKKKPTKNGRQILTVVSATQCGNGNVSQGNGNVSQGNGDISQGLAELLGKLNWKKKDNERRTRSEIRRRPITRALKKAARISKENTSDKPMITMNAEPKVNEDNMSVETITEISKPSSTGSPTKAEPTGPVPASQNQATKLGLCNTCNKSFFKSTLFTVPGNDHFLCSFCWRKSKAVDTVPPLNLDLNLDFQTHTAKSPVSSPIQQNHTRGKDIAGKTPDTAVKLDSSDEEEEVVNGTRSAMNSRKSHLQRPDKRIAYPSRTDPEAIEISDSDLQYLEPTEFLNDTIIDFYIKYIQRELLSLEDGSRFHFFSSFFYKKLSVIAGKKTIKNSDLSKLRKWSKGINIFEKDYLIIPVHDELHWSLAIVCFPKHGPGGSSRSERCILHLDSMVSGHDSDAIFRLLRRYLVAEWKGNFGEVRMDGDGGIHNIIPGKKVLVPLQENESDCGLFLLQYVQKFVKGAPKTLKIGDIKKGSLKSLGVFGRAWFSPREASDLRTLIQEKLQSLFAENEVVVGNTSFGDNDTVKPRKLEAEFWYVASTCRLKLAPLATYSSNLCVDA